MSPLRSITPAQRYRQAMVLARRSHDRSFRDFQHGRAEIWSGLPLYDRERECIIREIGRAFEAGRASAIKECASLVETVGHFHRRRGGYLVIGREAENAIADAIRALGTPKAEDKP